MEVNQNKKSGVCMNYEVYILTIQSDLMNFKFYCEEIEDSFKRNSHKVKEVLDLFQQNKDVDGLDYDREVDSFTEFYNQYKYDFPEIMRSSLLISVYAFFEQQLVSLCKPTDNGLSIKDIRGSNIIDRAKKYLEKILEVNVPANNKQWKFLKEVSYIRNCIVHNGGFVEQDSNMKKIQNIIKDLEFININQYGKIIIEQGFVEVMIDHIDNLLFDLLVSKDSN